MSNLNEQTPGAAIFGLSGLTLTDRERELFEAFQPIGFILFARNCDTPGQVAQLVQELRDLLTHPYPLILIDQEGGRVARLKPPHWRKALPAGVFAKMAADNVEQAKQAVFLNHQLIAQELYSLGINVDCTPLLDLHVSGSHDIIGDRAFGKTPEQVVTLAKEACNGLMDQGVLPVIKHIPGHGRAMVDSHESLPIVNADRTTLEREDFEPFKQLHDMPLAMTAHITYTALDAERPATLSSEVIRIIREEIGFQNLLMTDDISMKALSDKMETRISQSLQAGCDLILHCNGEMDEMEEIAYHTPILSEAGITRLQRAYSQLTPPKPLDIAAGEEALAGMVG